jgi:hypothetical protein
MATINDVLSEGVKQVLDKQVQHLLGLANETDKKHHRNSREWKLMYDGAETIMGLIGSELGLGKNTGLGIVINKMAYDELHRYKKAFDERIEEMESEPKVLIFGARTESTVTVWRKRRGEANVDLKRIIEEDLEDEDNYECSFGIAIKTVFESEVSKYISQ